VLHILLVKASNPRNNPLMSLAKAANIWKATLLRPFPLIKLSSPVILRHSTLRFREFAIARREGRFGRG
jgi:hypothetical protein